MDIVAKKLPPNENGVRLASLDEISYRYNLWNHKPLTDFGELEGDIVENLKHMVCILWEILQDVL